MRFGENASGTSPLSGSWNRFEGGSAGVSPPPVYDRAID
jgi:hypothetical protein